MKPATIANVRILDFGAVANDAVSTDVTVVTYQGVVTDNGIRAYICRSSYHRIFQHSDIITYDDLTINGSFL